MAFAASSIQERRRGAVVAAGLTALLGYALALGLALSTPERRGETLALFDIGAEPPPPLREKTVPHRVRDTKPEGAAAPPNLRSEPAEIVEPQPLVSVPVPPPVTAAPIAGIGSDASAGNADVPGPGTGAGGVGSGRGSGGEGDGAGAGGDETPPRWVRGQLNDSDYPDALAEAGVSGTVGVRYLVWTDGRVRDCEVTASSGSVELDALTCRLIRARFRFAPSRDAQGRPVPAEIVENHSWEIQREPAQQGRQHVRRRGLLR